MNSRHMPRSSTARRTPGVFLSPPVSHSPRRTSLGALLLVVALSAASGAMVTSSSIRANASVAPGSWSAVGPMNTGRYQHTLTLLTSPSCATSSPPAFCGKVLVVGGGRTAELYDPSNGTWSPTGSMNDARAQPHTATLLNDGRVLVVGGSSGTSAEIYDPEAVDTDTGLAGQWRYTAQPPFAQPSLGLRGHAATRLDGLGCQVASVPDDCGKVLVVGAELTGDGGRAHGRSSVAQLYDPRSIDDPTVPAWTLTPPMVAARSFPTATSLASGKVLVTGGDATNGTAELFDPTTKTWAPTKPLAALGDNCAGTASCFLATRLHDGTVLVVGGMNKRASQLYDPATESWSLAGSLGHDTLFASATLMPNGHLLVAGGDSGPSLRDPGFGSAAAELYDPATKTWAATGSLLLRRTAHAATLLVNGKVLVTGGAPSDLLTTRSAEVFDPTATAQAPSVLSIEPKTGDPSGGTLVKITGGAFEGVTSVNFGALTVTPQQVRLDTRPQVIEVISPPHNAAEVHITVTTARGVSGAFPQDRFNYVEPIGTWTPTGSLTRARKGNGTLTVLAAGKVLAAGGSDGAGDAIGEAELFDPLTGTWSPAGNMRVPRIGHAATLLPNGSVLMSGGRPKEGAPPLASVELYVPDSNSWIETDPLDIARVGHTASIIAGGQVMVAGGTGASPSSAVTGRPDTLDSVELYDPGTGEWRPAQPLTTARSRHTATLLDGPDCGGSSRATYCGRIVVTGGTANNDGAFSGTYDLASTEVYDPATGHWLVAGSLAIPRASHQGAVVALRTCGQLATPCVGVLVAGGEGIGSAELFDPLADGGGGAWRETGRLVKERVAHAVAPLADGRIMLVAGSQDASAEIYEPTSEIWTPARSMAEVRSVRELAVLSGPACAAAGRCGSVLVAGGSNNDAGSSAELFRPSLDVPTPVVTSVLPPAGPTFGGTAVTINGSGFTGSAGVKVQFGNLTVTPTSVSDTRITASSPPQGQGRVDLRVTVDNVGVSPASSLARFTYGSGAWTATGSVSQCPASDGCSERYLHTATLLDGPECHGVTPPEYCGKVLATGGTRTNFFEPPLAGSQLYDPDQGTWSGSGSLGVARFGHTATLLLDGRVLVVGGQDKAASGMTSVELYDPSDGTWRSCQAATATARCPAPLAFPRVGHTATVLQDGRVLVVGGADSEFNRKTPSTSAELYDPETGRWTVARPLEIGRENHTATLLSTGEVLVAGGFIAAVSPDRVRPTEPLQTPRVFNPVVTASAEVYDPVSGTWAKTGDMAVGRFDHTATVLSGSACAIAATAPPLCGKVLIAGGNAGGPSSLASSEVYDADAVDPVSKLRGRWTATDSLNSARSGHSASLLSDGTVLVTGSGATCECGPSFAPTSSAEVYDPSAKRWHYTSSLSANRGAHTSTVLQGPLCRGVGRTEHCDKVLVAGGYEAAPKRAAVAGTPTVVSFPLHEELYTPAPSLAGLAPEVGTAFGGDRVVLSGAGFREGSSVRFGAAGSPALTVESPERIAAVSPEHQPGPVNVAVIGPDHQTSASIRPAPSSLFTFVGTPGHVRDLAAQAVSESSVLLTFSAPDNGAGTGPAARYVVRQARAPIDGSNFDAADTLCETACAFSPAAAGERLTLSVSDLAPSTTYYYALRPVSANEVLGPLSNIASATTLPVSTASCPAVAAAPGQVQYPSGYSLVGLPEGNVPHPDSPLYGWFDKGAGAMYDVLSPVQAIIGGHGYWAWFSCPRLVDVGPGASWAEFPLGAYHASMIGNPSGAGSSAVSGHDFTARWDSSLNGGSGGYQVSGYREPQRLGVGQGLWVFSYEPTRIRVGPSG